jgi:hypothetical protein
LKMKMCNAYWWVVQKQETGEIWMGY